ncbi:MAG: methyltransferase [Desulfovibrio aminophilus]|jgi:tRNA(1-methyladenosine) methyltransferase and related methyltransferases|uniref:methyltransferase n=1 Tax=Desulfovibrio aminophilus TaxID=81425 RepID=UPI0039EACFCC
MSRPEIGGERDIQEIAKAFQESRVLLSAFELGVFTALGLEGLGSEEAAERLGADPRGLDRLLNALAALGFVRKDGGLFRNTEAAETFLNARSPRYLSGLAHTANVYKSWATLTDAVRRGGRVTERPSADSADTRSFIEAMHRRAKDDADALAALLDLSGVRRVLDLGGGSGAYSMAFCRAEPGLTAVVLDLPHVTPLTRRYVAAEGLSERIGTQDGDYHDADFGQGYDLVFLSAIAHINSAAENKRLVARAARALNPGGRVAVQDFIMDDDRTTPLHGALFALNMLVNTERGDTYTESEVRGWMEDAGLTDVLRLDGRDKASLVVGRLAER